MVGSRGKSRKRRDVERSYPGGERGDVQCRNSCWERCMSSAAIRADGAAMSSAAIRAESAAMSSAAIRSGNAAMSSAAIRAGTRRCRAQLFVRGMRRCRVLQFVPERSDVQRSYSGG